MTIKKFKNCDLKGFQLIIGTPSVGNVGQFACDLLIESLQLDKFAMVS